MIELNFFIFGRKWQIKVVEAHDPLLWVNDRARVGATWPLKRIIGISNELTIDRFEDVVAHELVHVVIAETSFNDPKEYDEEHLSCFYENFHRVLEETLKEIMALYNHTINITDNSFEPLYGEDSEHFRGV